MGGFAKNVWYTQLFAGILSSKSLDCSLYLMHSIDIV